MKHCLIVFFMIVFIGNAFPYQFVFQSNDEYKMYNTETKELSEFFIVDDAWYVHYQTREHVVFTQSDDANNFYFDGDTYRSTSCLFYDKISKKKIGQIDTLVSCTYNAEYNRFIGLLGGTFAGPPGHEVYRVVIQGAFTYTPSTDDLEIIYFPSFATSQNLLPGISIKSDEQLLAVLTGENEISYYDISDLSKLVRKESSSLWSYSSGSNYSCGGISNIVFNDKNMNLWNPEYKMHCSKYIFLRSKHRWLKDRNIYMISPRDTDHYFFNPKTQETKFISDWDNFIHFYDNVEDLFIIRIYNSNLVNNIEYNAIKAKILLDKWGVSNE